MDAVAVFALIEKGLTIVTALIAAGQSVEPAMQALMNLVTGAKQGTVTPEQLAQTEELLDQQVTDFNSDIQ